MFQFFPALKKSWEGAKWSLAHDADRLAEPLSGSLYGAKFRLGGLHPQVRFVFEMTPERVHVLNGDFVYDDDPSAG